MYSNLVAMNNIGMTHSGKVLAFSFEAFKGVLFKGILWLIAEQTGRGLEAKAEVLEPLGKRIFVIQFGGVKLSDFLQGVLDVRQPGLRIKIDNKFIRILR